MAQLVNKFYEVTEAIQYFTGSVTTTTATKTYAATAITAGFSVGDKVVFSGFSNSASNGEKTIATLAVDTNSLTVSEVIGTGENGVTAKMNQVSYGAWQDVAGCTVLIGTIQAAGACELYLNWSWDGSTVNYTSAAQEITGGTAAIINEVAVVAPFVRTKLLAKDADSATMVLYFGGRDY